MDACGAHGATGPAARHPSGSCYTGQADVCGYRGTQCGRRHDNRHTKWSCNGMSRVASSLYGLLDRSEEHTSELQSQSNLVCRLLLEKKKTHRVSDSALRTTS